MNIRSYLLVGIVALIPLMLLLLAVKLEQFKKSRMVTYVRMGLFIGALPGVYLTVAAFYSAAGVYTGQIFSNEFFYNRIIFITPVAYGCLMGVSYAVNLMLLMRSKRDWPDIIGDTDPADHELIELDQNISH